MVTKAGELETLISIYSSMFSPGEHALEYEVGAPSCSCLDEVARLKGKDLYALSQHTETSPCPAAHNSSLAKSAFKN